MKQETPRREPIELYLKQTQVAQSSQKEFMKFKKDDLLEIITPLANFLANYEVTGAPGSESSLVMIASNISREEFRRGLLKEEIILFYLSFVDDLRNYYELALKDIRLMTLWRMILRMARISQASIKVLTDYDVEVRSAGYWNATYAVDAMFAPLSIALVVPGTYSYGTPRSKDSYIFTMKASTRKNLAEIFIGKDAVAPHLASELPDARKMHTEDFESVVTADLIFLSGMGMTGNLAGDNPATSAKLKELQKNFNTPGFSSNDSNPWPQNRVEMLFNAYSCYYGHVKYSARYNSKKDNNHALEEERLKTSVGDFAKFVVERLPGYIRGSWFGMLFPEFKSFTKAWADSSYIVSITEILNSMLRESCNEWMALDNLKLRYLTTLPRGSYYRNYVALFDNQAKNKSTLKYRRDDSEVAYDMMFSWFDCIDFPFLLRWMRLLCSVGVLELAIAKKYKMEDDDLEGIRYVRLTALGRYAFGLTKHYDAPEVESSDELDIDDRNCILTVLSDNYPYIIFLQQTAEAISKNRYKLSPESIVRNCVGAEMVKSRIANLRKIIPLKENPGIERVVREAENRMDCASLWPNSYTIYQLKPEASELAKLLVANPEIRKNVILAEHGLILVDKNFVVRFKTLCSRLGYII